jgi:hypothetical protein
MESRRRYLAGVGAAAFAALAGCTGRFDGDDDAAEGETPTGGASAEERLTLPVPESELDRGAGKDDIPAIVDPVFAEDWSGYGTGDSPARLSADDRIVGVARAGEARAYPLRILNWHEVVNDSLPTAEGEEPLLVTYCPLCGSALTAVRRAGDMEATFGVSGLLFRNDLVMYDTATDSLWSQVAATAIRGELTGETLELVPSTLTTLGEWRETHPETVVLRPPPDSSTVRGSDATRDYGRNPYAGYAESREIGVGLSGSDYDDDRLHPKTTVIGVTDGGEAVAYPLSTVREAGVVNDRVGDLPVVVAATGEGTLVAYVRRVDGEATPFERADESHLRAAGSRWRVADGRAVDGPHEGVTLSRANEVSPLFFFAWKEFNPDTVVHGTAGG